MSLPSLNIEFSSAVRSPSLGAFALAAVGAIALLGVSLQYRAAATRAEGLQLQLAEKQRLAAPAFATSIDTPQMQADAATVTAELATPWSQLLGDLETAGVDSKGAVALLGIEPDRATGRVKLTAEARSLPAALTYLQRLQRSGTLQHPLLDSHEVRVDVPERPVHVQISADWRVRS